MGWFARLLGQEPGTARVTVTAPLTTFERVPIVGESHYQPALRAICGAERGEEVSHDCFAELVSEPDNPHDPNAIMVRIDGQCVGYLSRDNAVKYGPMIAAMLDEGQPTICNAFVGCLGEESGNPNIGVSLEIPLSG